MINEIKAENYDIEFKKRGTGEIGTSYDYFKYISPTTYYYEKLKAQNNKYLRADMWAEAAKRGESNTLINSIMNQSNNKDTNNEYYETWLDWEGYNNYDSYMLALQIPNLDDNVKIERTSTLDDGSIYSFGEYTDKEWAIKIFNEEVGHWKAKQVEENKENKTVWTHIGDFCKTVFASMPLHALSGITDFIGDIWNLFEGVSNIFINWSEDADVGDRFLYAFQNNDNFNKITTNLRKAAFELEYNTLLVDSNKAYEQGYRGPNGDITGVGYSDVGQLVNGITESIGYMLPSILIQLVPGVGQATTIGAMAGKVGTYVAKNLSRFVFYSGVLSGNIKNTVNTAKINGISYQDLNAGKVIANASLKAIAQYAIEEALSLIIGASRLDRMFGQTQKGVFNKNKITAPTSEIASASKVVLGGIKGSIKEGLEEFLQDTSDALIDLAFGVNSDAIYKQMGEDTLNIKNLVNSFVAGALTSMIIGTVSNAKFLWNRAYGMNTDGKAYKLGFFQTIDYVNSLKLMNEWNETIKNSTNEETKLDAAMKLATAYDTMSQIFKNIGESETIKANKSLIAQASVENTKKSALMKMSTSEYADKLIDDFTKNAKDAHQKYIKDKIKRTIKRAIEVKEKDLKESLVTKIKNIFTKQSKIDNKEVNTVTQEKVVDIIDKTKSMAIVAHDGTYVGFSGDILFVPENMLDNINEALEVAEYREVIETVIPKLSVSQKRLIKHQFEKVTGVEGTIEDAVTALLFDKNFYCSILFLSAERKGYKPEAFKILATIDQIIKNKLAQKLTRGNLRDNIYMQIILKVQDNMRAGLINFTTKYAKIDLGEISNEVLSAEIKEVIRNNPNFLYTELINKCLYNYKTITEKDRNRLVLITKNLKSVKEEIKQDIIKALDSNNPERIADAARAIEYLRKNDESDMSKIVYLPTNTSEQIVKTTIEGIEEFIGLKWDDLLSGNIDATKFTKEFSDYLKSIGGIDWTNSAERLRFLDNIIFDKSNHTFTIDVNGNILKVIDKFEFCNDRYNTRDGIRNLREDVKSGKVKSVNDISILKLDDSIGKTKIKFKLEAVNGETAYYDPKNKTIVFTAKARSIDSILHEITHNVQDVLANTSDKKINRRLKNGEVINVKSIGTNTNKLESLPEDIKNSISNWLKEHSPIYYNVTANLKGLATHEIIYFMVDGELKARTTADVFVRECGFLYNSDESMLIAPDGTSWKMNTNTNSNKAVINVFKNYIKEEENRLKSVTSNLNSFENNLKSAKNELNKYQPNSSEYEKIKKSVDFYQNLVNQFRNEKSKIEENLGITQTDNEDNNIYFDISEDEEPSRYIPVNVAKQSNLKYWAKANKGKPIYINPRVANFVIATTEDFDKLSPTIQRLIIEAKLTKDILQKYIATAAHIDDFTFQAIAREFYNNEEVAKLTYNDMITIFNHINEFSAMSNFIDEGKDTIMTFDQMIQRYNELKKLLEKDTTLSKNYGKAVEFTRKKKLVGNKGVFYELVDIDINQLNTIFFRLYDGTLDSLYQINNIAKDIAYHQPTGDTSFTSNDKAMSAKGSFTKYENAWKTRAKYAVINYDNKNNDIVNALDGVDLRDKVITIQENYKDIFIKQMQNLNTDASNENKTKILQDYKQGLNELNNKLKNASEDEINQLYINALGMENNKVSEENYQELIARKSHITKEQSTIVTLYNNILRRGRAIARTYLSNKIVNFNKLPDNVKQYFTKTKNGYVFTFADNHKINNITDNTLRRKAQKEAYEQNIEKFGENGLSKLNNDLIKARELFINEEAKIKQTKRKLKQTERELEQTKNRLDRMTRLNVNKETKKSIKENDSQKTIKEKIAHKYKVTVHETNFSFNSNSEANNVVIQLLNTQFSKRNESKVQGLISENQDKVVTSGKEFFVQNADIFLNSTITEIEDAVAWFLDSELQVQNATEDEFRIYQAVKLLFLGYVLSETKADGVYSGFNNDLRQEIESELHKIISAAGTLLSHWKEILKLINPVQAMTMMDMEIDGVQITQDLKTQLFEAIMSNDIDKIKEAEKSIYDFIRKNSPKGQSFLRRLSNLRSIAMLSSPITWLRNKVSNFMLKRIYKISDIIGKKVFNKKHVKGQLKLDKQITPEIQAFITEHFIDNKLFDSFVSNLSKYNPSDINERRNISEKAKKEEILARLVLKSMYSEYYNNETFKSPIMRKAHEFIMRRLSDNNYVRESAIKFFGKILAEKNYDLTKNEVTDSIMNDFANSVGLAMSEYMHSDNFFHDIERVIGNKSEIGHFIYKMFMPYAASSWNWFKAMIKLSPIGLGRAVIQMIRLEKNVAKAQANFLAGKTQIAGELSEYMIRRDFGQGVIGTILWGLGIGLAALGIMKLDDDDYGKPKIKLGNVEIDVSSVFSSSSLLAGAAFITQLDKNGIDWNTFTKSMNSMLDIWSDQLPIMDIIQMDMYSEGTFSLGLDQLGTILLSFIPNGVKYIAGATYTGNLKKTNFLDRAMSNIPFLTNFVSKKVDPYTGKYEENNILSILNRLIPYFSYHAASKNQINTTALGLNKKMLNGKYTINDKSLRVKGKDLTAINQAYGKWNAYDLTKFYNNQLSVKVKVGNTYKTLKYNQMTAEQQKKTVQSIMSNNAELAKIAAWLNAGNKYYASATTYNKLHKAGFTKGLYRGTKGFVEK